MNITTDIKYLLSESSKGNPKAAYLAGCQLLSSGCNPVLWQKQIRNAAEMGFVPALRLMGLLGICGKLLDPASEVSKEIYMEEPSSGIPWLTEGVKKHDVVSAYVYAKCMQLGIGLPKDEETAKMRLESIIMYIPLDIVLDVMMIFDRIRWTESHGSFDAIDIRVFSKLAS